MRLLVLAAAILSASACGRDDREPANWVHVESLYWIAGDEVVCAGPVDMHATPAGGPFTDVTCYWERVVFDGLPRCYVLVRFSRQDEASPWAERVLTTLADCGG